MIYYIDAQIRLNNLTWSASGAGLVYSNDFDATNGVAKTILCVTETGFSNIRSTDVIKPFISTDAKKIRFMSNTTTFHNADAALNVRVVYLK